MAASKNLKRRSTAVVNITLGKGSRTGHSVGSDLRVVLMTATFESAFYKSLFFYMEDLVLVKTLSFLRVLDM